MRILFLAWKDIRHPDAGGAEVVLWELATRLVKDNHEVTVLTCGYDGAKDRETMDGIDVIRVGHNRYLHSFQALAYYIRHLRNGYDRVIETVNTAAYFSVLFGTSDKRAKRYLLCHQLAREIWFYETKPPLSHIGYYVLEPIALRLLSFANVPMITVSESSRRDLLRFGFRPDMTQVISEGIQLQPVKDLKSIRKYPKPTMLGLGAMRAMKRTLDQVAAFEMAKASIPDLQLKLAGSSDDPYGREVLQRIAASPFPADIEYLGRVSEADKLTLMQRSHLIAVTSIKEGWGLIVTEANSQGTPAVVYDVDGLRDSVQHNQTGIITTPNPHSLAEGITTLLTNKKLYQTIQKAAWQSSQTITFDRSYTDFRQVIEV